jgi:hypothetical protein
MILETGSAKGAQYESQGQARSEASASPPDQYPNRGNAALKGRNTVVHISAFQASTLLLLSQPGATRSLRFALAPGFHIPRRWRC